MNSDSSRGVHWVVQMNAYVAARGRTVETLYFGYTTCPWADSRRAALAQTHPRYRSCAHG